VAERQHKCDRQQDVPQQSLVGRLMGLAHDADGVVDAVRCPGAMIAAVAPATIAA
jgi:hypothetical protein